ncbi:hypothetical protein H696_00191 [Fonticula alba]|uniref:Uncharacterized protein n=1 Tax=Fonticula alba TaxID=691883 RepID=A0A058ZGI6_FONAL|nr:hypothetical protein H696_00191 [Fonticula alba]KCV72607.1 hypothetical protein H696_00191 [Fonticula alba]|eukprot:XP_009492308.1 hypothetical protein H696_00191 [Fonticula alba]
MSLTTTGLLVGHKQSVTFLAALDPVATNADLASGSADGTALLWDLRKPGAVGCLAPGRGPIEALTSSQSSIVLSVADAPEAMLEYDVRMPDRPMVQRMPSRVLASAEGAPRRGAPAPSKKARAAAAAAAPVGSTAARVTAAALSPSGRRLVIGDADGRVRTVLWPEAGPDATLRPAPTARLPDTLAPSAVPWRPLPNAHSSLISCITFRPTKPDIVFTGGLDSTITMWACATRNPLHVWPMPDLLGPGVFANPSVNPPVVNDMVCSTDGRFLLAALGSGATAVVDLTPFEDGAGPDAPYETPCVAGLVGHSYSVNCVELVPRGGGNDPSDFLIVTASNDRSLAVWPIGPAAALASDGAPAGACQGPDSQIDSRPTLSALPFSPNALLATGGGARHPGSGARRPAGEFVLAGADTFIPIFRLAE